MTDRYSETGHPMRDTARTVLGITSGKRKKHKEVWWWNEEVQTMINRKKLAKKKRHAERR